MIGLRVSAIAEAVTLLALFAVAMPIKYMLGEAQLVSIIGPVHGLAFMVFLWFVLRSWAEGIIDGTGVVRLVIGAMLPVGGFVNEHWLRKQGDNGSTLQ